jgi:glucosamine 6-phosphate synthetase-like amidotransferase/phosphosugar isomerase protein
MRLRRWPILSRLLATVLYLGRGQDYPLALEGALKLKKSAISTPKAMPAAR